MRWTQNDINSKSILAGLLSDLGGNSNRFFAEFEQRLNDDVKLLIDTSISGNIDQNDFTYAFKEDSQITVKIAKYF